MNILFHDNSLCERGTTVALFDYAKYNEEILGNQSYICFGNTSKHNDQTVIDKFKNRFPGRLVSYENFENDKILLNNYCVNNNITHSYFMKSGEYDGKLLSYDGCVNLIHAVFQAYQPHGNKYAYISEWLSNKISKLTNNNLDYVPYIVDMPSPSRCIRKELNIPNEALVIGRHGGVEQFDIPFVRNSVIQYANRNVNCYFIFVNTEKFCNHERILFLDKIIDMQEKSNFINSCDAMIHGRSIGESFGLAFCEFLYHNKPVLAFNGGNDQHHIDVLKDSNCLYDPSNIMSKFEMLEDKTFRNKDWKKLVDKFNPKLVMDKFKMVFLK
jgi:hypothetical protein